MPIKIIAKKDGFRRAGLAHVGTVIYPDDHFTAKQLEALKAEKNLDVSVCEDAPTVDSEGKDAPADGQAKSEAKGKGGKK